MRKYIFIFLISLIVFSVEAQEQADLKYDYDGLIEIRTSGEINRFLDDEFYLYDRELVKPPTTFLKKLLDWIFKFFRFLDKGGKPVSYAFYALMFAILLFVIIKVLGLNYQSIFIRSAKIRSKEIDVFDEDIHAVNFDAVINDAVKNENYRKALRYLYIKFLKILVDNELIEWEINKTNKDYRREMKKSKYFSIFKSLTFVYEYVWYGEFDVNYQQFNDFRSDFNKVYRDFK